jgi:uncharacterized protein (TIGR03663 family)
MIDKRLFIAGVVVAILVALILRVPGLDERPMHHDEANQAVRSGELQQSFEYAYDPADHHGPSLYYLTLPSACLFSGRDFSGTNEWTFRLVPVFFGILLLLLFLLLKDGIGRSAVIFSILFGAVSPALVWYSRFYIHEMLLVCFTMGVIASVWRYLQSGRLVWVILGGIFVGLMAGTKETWVIAVGSMLCSGIVTAVWCRFDTETPGLEHKGTIAGYSAAVLAALFVVVLLYTSFFMNMRGVLDAVQSYGVYVKRGISGGLHKQPWYYYLWLLRYESAIMSLAVMGGLCVIFTIGRKSQYRRLSRFILVYTVVLTIMYSILSYKTPWCICSLVCGMILLAGIGVGAVATIVKTSAVKYTIYGSAVLVAVILGWQAWTMNGTWRLGRGNPYAYVETSPDIKRFERRMNELAQMDRDGYESTIQVIVSSDRMWPLPWYLRRFSNTGYWTVQAKPEIIKNIRYLVTSPGIAADLPQEVKEQYMVEYFGLREDVLVVLQVRKDIWERYMESRK